MVEPGAARAAAEQAVAIAKANAILATRTVTLANADKVVTTWSGPIKRDPFEVPLETKTAFLMKLNETALAVAGVSSQILLIQLQIAGVGRGAGCSCACTLGREGHA